MVKDLQQQVASRPDSPSESTTRSSRKKEPAADSKAAIPPEPAPHEPDLATNLQSDPLPEPKHSDLSIFNPEISAAIDAVGSYSSAADNLNFIARDVEIMVQSNVDQLAHAYVVFNAESELDPWAKSDSFGEASLGVEEAAIETTALPYGLALKGGEFFADFSRLGKVHSHELPFTDRPASLEGIIGGEAKARGLELSWVPPVGHYFRFTAGAVDNIGADMASTGVFSTLNGDENDLFARSNNRSISDITYYGRAATIFELSDSTSLNVGVDYSHGQDVGKRQMASADFKLTWIPEASSFDRLEVGGEVLHGKTEGDFSDSALAALGPVSGSSTSDGAYVYAQYRIGKDWEPGIRYDWFRPEIWSETDSNSDGVADGLARTRDTRNSVEAYLTYNLSEFNRLRLGVSHVTSDTDSFAGKDSDWLTYLQWSIVIGPHKHSFQP